MSATKQQEIKHPAKFSPTIIDAIRELLDGNDWMDKATVPSILDPMAGTGGVLKLLDDEATRMQFGQVDAHWWLNEIEPEWAAVCQEKLALYHADGSVTTWDWLNAYCLRRLQVDVVITSPTYGNRMADHHRAGDDSRRITYKHVLGRDLHPNNSGQLQWGAKYREFHRAAWKNVWEVLKPGGVFILNVSDHVRAGRVVRAAAWHLMTCRVLGFQVIETRRVPTPRMRMGANGDVRVEHEMVYMMRKP